MAGHWSLHKRRLQLRDRDVPPVDQFPLKGRMTGPQSHSGNGGGNNTKAGLSVTSLTELPRVRTKQVCTSSSVLNMFISVCKLKKKKQVYRGEKVSCTHLNLNRNEKLFIELL